MMKPDEMAQALSRLCPLDGDTGTGEMHPKWDEANLHAAKHICENLDNYSKVYERSLLNRVSRRNELNYMLVKKARELRNDYLAKGAQ
jgi:hypothetical protein